MVCKNQKLFSAPLGYSYLCNGKKSLKLSKNFVLLIEHLKIKINTDQAKKDNVNKGNKRLCNLHI